MTALGWLVTYLVVLLLTHVIAPEDTTLRIYVGIFFMGGAFRGIVNILWRKLDD